MTDSTSHIPVALAQPEAGGSWLRHLIWLIPVAALAASVGFTLMGARDQGPVIVIHAAHGHGLDEGDPVRYLGIDVGIVKGVTLGSSGDEADVRLEVQLTRDAGDLARAGTKFWIVRPQLSLDSIDGLETIIGARYLALYPGPKDAERRTQFTALSEPPLADEVRGGMGLEIVLEAPTR
ncbi:MAG: MlaD family protein, partial [Planctomycetota bacterium]